MKLALLLLLAIAAHSAEPVLRGQIIQGPGIEVKQTNLGWLVGVDAPLIQKLIREEAAAILKTAPVSVSTAKITGSAQLDFLPIQDGTCEERTFSLPGVLKGDYIVESWPDMEPSIIGKMRASADGQIAVKLCNFNGVSGAVIDRTVDPPSRRYGVAVIR